MTTKDEFNPFDPPQNTDDLPQPIKDAIKQLGTTVEEELAKERQKKIEAMSTEDIRAAIANGAADLLGSAANMFVKALVGMKAVGASDALIDEILTTHAEVQVKILNFLQIQGPESMQQEIFNVEREELFKAVAVHSGIHKGCVIDEYRRRTEDDWEEVFDDLEPQGGVS